MADRSGTVPNTTTPSTEQVVPASILPNTAFPLTEPVPVIIIPNTALPTEQAVPVNFPAVSNESAAAINEDMDISNDEAFTFQSPYPPIPSDSTATATTSTTDYVDAGEEYIIYYSSEDEYVASPRTRRLDN